MQNHKQLLDWVGRSLCLLLPVIGLLVLQGMPASALTVDAIASGRWLTLWSGHLLHYTMDHFMWDALMFVVFTCLLWPKERWGMWLWLVVAAPVISILVFLVEPGLQEYRGLSALDTMLYVRFCIGLLRSASKWDRWLFGALPVFGLTLKIGYEWMTEQALFVTDLGAGVVPLPSAHLAGLVLGLLWGITRAAQQYPNALRRMAATGHSSVEDPLSARC
jgi:rhomboid family GlyGly-CTERM serine protease